MSITIFGFSALWSPYYLVILLMITVSYIWFVNKVSQRKFGSFRATKKQVFYFLLAMILLYTVKGSPIDLMSHIMFSAHMTQMAILYLIIPPLFIISIPDWIWNEIVGGGNRQALISFFTKPLIALLSFNILFSLYHLPVVFDHIKTNMVMHAGYTTLLFIFALFMWFPLVNQFTKWESLNGVKKVAYIFVSGILLTPACALIIFADSPLYSTYTNPDSWANAMRLCVPIDTLSSLNLSGPEIFSGMAALEDQQLGGVLMKIIQEIVLGYVLGVIFFAWYRKENGGNNSIDPIPTDLKTAD